MEDTRTYSKKKREALFTRSFGWINTSERPKSLQQQQLRNCGMWYSVFMFKMVEIDKASYYLPSHQVTFLECVFFFSACWWKTLSNLMLLLSLSLSISPAKESLIFTIDGNLDSLWRLCLLLLGSFLGER